LIDVARGLHRYMDISILEGECSCHYLILGTLVQEIINSEAIGRGFGGFDTQEANDRILLDFS